MPHVQATTGVREHGEAIKFFLVGIFDDLKSRLLFPDFLDLRLDFLGIVFFLHFGS